MDLLSLTENLQTHAIYALKSAGERFNSRGFHDLPLNRAVIIT